MSVVNRTPIIHQNFLDFLSDWSGDDEPDWHRSSAITDDLDVTWHELYQIFRCMCAIRQLDRKARSLKSRGEGYYTIASAGHECDAAIAKYLKLDDPGMVHYRAGAFMCWRILKRTGELPIKDILRSFVASKKDPVAGGRHKVFGDHESWILPQTSTIASHLPRAVGMAFGIERMKHLNVPLPVSEDAIVHCSFGDASVNHSSLQGAMNAVQWTAHQNLPVPLLMICEDNQLGISVPTPSKWIQSAIEPREYLAYYSCEGTDPVDVLRTSRKAVTTCREQRKPVFLHLKTARLLGHAGSDVELEYRSLQDIQQTEKQDPLIHFAEAILASGTYSPDELRSTYTDLEEQIEEILPGVLEEPKLTSADEIMEPLQMEKPEVVREEATRTDYPEKRKELFGSDEEVPEQEDKPRTLAQLLNLELTNLMAKYPEMAVFGEDVAQKGGVYYVTRDLYDRAGPGRVFNTLLDETTILGIGLGMSSLGMLPFPEIQYLAYLYNAYDQLRGEAGCQPFYSNGHVDNPMIVRIPSFGYQEGIGGHFHNDSGIGAIREIPGIVIAAPSRGDDAVRMLRTATALAKKEGKVVVFLEPIALYHTRDLHEEDDEGWMKTYPSPDEAADLGEPRIYNDGEEQHDLTILTYGNGTYYSLQAAEELSQTDDLRIRVVDLRWLKPLNRSFLEQERTQDHPILIVDEARSTGSPSEEICSILVEDQEDPPRVRRLTAEDSYVPIGPAADEILPTKEDIRKTALQLTR